MTFYLLFTAVYGGMHWLVFSQASAALSLRGPARLALLAALVVLALLPLLMGFRGERTGVVAFAAFSWMGLVFYLFLACLPLAAIRPFVSHGVHAACFAVALSVCLGVCVYGALMARQVHVVRVEVATDKLPPGVDRLRLAVLSDLHLYSVEEGRRLDRILPVLAGLDYDLLVSLGDLVEAGAHREDWPASAKRLAALTPRLGKFAVDGNHEVYANRLAGEDLAGAFLDKAGFTRLRGQWVKVGEALYLAGLDYAGAVWAAGVSSSGEADILATVPRDLPVVVLKHLPTADPKAVGMFDLQLSGHTHAGQMWPFNWLVKAFFPFMQGRYNLGQGSTLYVNVGAGTWGPPMRVGSSPEITLVTLVRPH